MRFVQTRGIWEVVGGVALFMHRHLLNQKDHIKDLVFGSMFAFVLLIETPIWEY